MLERLVGLKKYLPTTQLPPKPQSLNYISRGQEDTYKRLQTPGILRETFIVDVCLDGEDGLKAEPLTSVGYQYFWV
jgi:hypothetical protein